MKKLKKKSEPPKPPPKPTFDVEKIAERMRFIDLDMFVGDIFNAIAEARGMAGALPPDECDEQRLRLDMLHAVVAFIFGVDEVVEP